MKNEIYKYVGDLSQICGIRDYKIQGGRADGVRAFDVTNGSGLEFTILPDRGMDISRLSFNGINCSYLSKTGIVSPAYNGDMKNFFRGFYGGFMTTCGLRNVGNACEDGGEEFGIHGRISNIPAEEVCHEVNYNEVPEMTVSGKVRETAFFGENMVLERTVSCRYGENRIKICNTVENIGFRSELLMLLFHFNIGYPLLSESSVFLSSSAKVMPRDDDAAKGIGSYNKMQEPMKVYREQVFYHELNCAEIGETKVAFVNPELKIAISLCFNKKQLPLFTQWKQMGEGEYVCGMEPCNCFVGGRLDPRNKDIATYIAPFERKSFDIEVELHYGDEQIAQLYDEIDNI